MVNLVILVNSIILKNSINTVNRFNIAYLVMVFPLGFWFIL